MAALPDMIGLVVKDIDSSLAFYSLLGWDLPASSKGEPYFEYITSNGYRISWNSVEMIKGIDEGYVSPVGYRLELACKCESPADVDLTYTAVTGAGYEGHKEPWDAFWGQRYAIVTDPDGNHVSLFCPLG